MGEDEDEDRAGEGGDEDVDCGGVRFSKFLFAFHRLVCKLSVIISIFNAHFYCNRQ